MGSSIPMIKKNHDKFDNNEKLYTKENGELSKFKNVFIIDSTSLPNIPAGDISLTIMANAYRVAAEDISK